MFQRTLLQSAVANFRPLHSVKLQDDIEVAHGRDQLSFTKYKDLLLAAAQSYDHSQSIRGGRRSANQHDFFSDYHHNDDETGGDLNDDIDYDGNFEVHFGNTNPKPFLGRDYWRNMDEATKQSWIKMDDKDKGVLLKILNQPSKSSKPTSSPRQQHGFKPRGNPRRNANNTETNPTDDTGSDDSPPDDTPNEDNVDSDSGLIAMMMEQARPGSVDRLLGSKSKRQAKVHIQVSEHRSNVSKSLVDRGANGGIMGSDARIISKSGRFVDVS